MDDSARDEHRVRKCEISRGWVVSRERRVCAPYPFSSLAMGRFSRGFA